MRFAELAERLALSAHGAEHGAVQIELEDQAGVAVREPELLIGRDKQPARRARVFRLAYEIAIAIEHLDALVVAVGDVDEALAVDHDRMGEVELSGPLALRAPQLDEIAVPV